MNFNKSIEKMYCCKQNFEEEEKVTQDYSKNISSQPLQKKSTTQQSEQNQDLSQPQICDQENNIQTSHSIFLVRFNNQQQETNQQQNSQEQNHSPLQIGNQTNDNQRLQTTIQQEFDLKINSNIGPEPNSLEAEILKNSRTQKFQTPSYLIQKKIFQKNDEFSETCDSFSEQQSLKQNSNDLSHTQVLQALCKYCDQWVSKKYIMLECQHIYCIECLKEELKQQCLTPECIKFYCRCTIKISEKTIHQLRKDYLIPNILNKLRENQIKKLISLAKYFYKTWTCPNKYCKFICIIQDNLNINLFYCPNCLCFSGQCQKQ